MFDGQSGDGLMTLTAKALVLTMARLSELSIPNRLGQSQIHSRRRFWFPWNVRKRKGDTSRCPL